MPETLISQRHLGRILGTARVLKLVRAGWIVPVERNAVANLFDLRDVRAVLRRLEREACPPDRIAVLRIRDSEQRNGRGRVRKIRCPKPGIDDLVVDFSGFNL